MSSCSSSFCDECFAFKKFFIELLIGVEQFALVFVAFFVCLCELTTDDGGFDEDEDDKCVGANINVAVVFNNGTAYDEVIDDPTMSTMKPQAMIFASGCLSLNALRDI